MSMGLDKTPVNRGPGINLVQVLTGSVLAGDSPDRSLLTVKRIYDSRDYAAGSGTKDHHQALNACSKPGHFGQFLRSFHGQTILSVEISRMVAGTGFAWSVPAVSSGGTRARVSD
jgi:hypothetical protein